MQDASKIAVAGATGRVGRHIVEVLRERGHEVVAISRAHGVDVISGDGLRDALAGADRVIDAATGPSPEQQAATDFFVTAARNLHAAGVEAGVERIVAVSIIGCDRFAGGYSAAKVAHEEALRAGPIPVGVLRASQFHEFVEQLLEWGTHGDLSYVPEMRTQPVAARTVAETLVDLATARELPGGTRVAEIAGPREESMVELARLLVARRGDRRRVAGVTNSADPDSDLYASGALLPSAHATLTGPTFRQWLETQGGTHDRGQDRHTRGVARCA